MLNSSGKEESGFLSYLFRGQQGGGGTRSHRPNNNDTKLHPTNPPTRNHHQTMPLTPEPSPTIDYNSLSDKEEIETQLIMTLLHSYFSIVRKNLLDSVPKAIMHFLVNHVVEQLGTRLVTDLYKEEMFVTLLQEDDAVVKQRARCKTALEAYRQAATILTELRDSDVNIRI